jgi:hypothetical protein
VLCDAYLATLPADEREFRDGVRWWLDDTETAAGHPHRHITTLTGADLDAYMQALERERADVDELHELKHELHALVKNTLFRDHDGALWPEAEARLYRAGDVITPATVTALIAEMYQREQQRTYYLGGAPSIVREPDGEYSFITARTHGPLQGDER